MTKAVVVHLGLVVTGWWIVTATGPAVRGMLGAREPEASIAPTKSVRVRMDPEGGQRLLARLRGELAPTVVPESTRTPVSLDERIDRLIAYDVANRGQAVPHEDREQYRERAIFGEMAGIVHGSNGPDYSYAFRHGRMEAQDILDLLVERMPEHANDPYFPVKLYHCLVRQDPARAEPLLAGLPDRERVKQHDALLSGREPILSEPRPVSSASVLPSQPPSGLHAPVFYAEEFIMPPDPEFAMALLANVPWQNERYRQFGRWWVWTTCARQLGSHYYDDYVAWLRSLPASQDRDLALQRALAHSPASSERSAYSSR